MNENWHKRFGATKNGFNQFVYDLPEKQNFKIKVVFTGDYVMLRQGSGRSTSDDLITVWNKDLTKRDMYVSEWKILYQALTGEELTETGTI